MLTEGFIKIILFKLWYINKNITFALINNALI